jgi:hypothetical protein
LNYYLSDDALFQRGDTKIGSENVACLGSGESATITTQAEIPPDTSPGRRYILWMSDAESQVNESDETNNLARAASVIIIESNELSVNLKTMGGLIDENVSMKKNDIDKDGKVTLKDTIMILQRDSHLR